MLHAIVTGGLQGIGRAIVEKLQDRGDNVFVFDCVEKDDQRVTQLRTTGVEYFCVDVSSVDSIKKGFSAVSQILDSQNSKLDVLINNAGITRDGIAIRMSEKNWDDVLDVNLKGSFFCAQQAIKQMMRNKKGYIINISSVVAITGNAGQTNYSASKAGIIAMTKSLAAEYGGRNILINAIAPGFIETEMTQKLPDKIKDQILKRISLKRLGQPEDIAQAVDFLTSGKADYITSTVLDLNGGLF